MMQASKVTLDKQQTYIRFSEISGYDETDPSELHNSTSINNNDSFHIFEIIENEKKRLLSEQEQTNN